MTNSIPAPGSDIQGRPLDAAVAEKVMGYLWVKHGDKMPSAHPGHRFLAHPSIFDKNAGFPHPLFVKAEGDEPIVGGDDDSIPKFSEDISAAWLVVERMHELGWHYDLGCRPDFDTPQHEASFDNGKAGEQWQCVFDISPTAPLALCRAALRVMESLT